MSEIRRAGISGGVASIAVLAALLAQDALISVALATFALVFLFVLIRSPRYRILTMAGVVVGANAVALAWGNAEISIPVWWSDDTIELKSSSGAYPHIISAVLLLILYLFYKTTVSAGRDGSEQTQGSAVVRGPVVGKNVTITQVVGKTAETTPATEQLPQLTQLEGREATVSSLVGTLSGGDPNVAGVHGLGGIGKTAVALAVAERLRSSFPDGRLYIDVRGTSKNPVSVEEVQTHVILSIAPDSELPAETARRAGLYRTLLSKRRVLLLADNVDQADTIRDVIPPSPSALLFTSRSDLGDVGGVAQRLDVLDTEAAVRVVAALCPRLQAQEAETLATLCNGIPLALRVGASAIESRPDLAVSVQLDRLRKADSSDLIGAALEATSSLMPEEIRRAWRLLSAFVGPFDTDGVARLVDVPVEKASDVVGTLLKRCVVEFDERRGRYYIHDVVRAFLRSRQTQEEATEAKVRHAQHAQALAEHCGALWKKGGEHRDQALRDFELAKNEIESAISWGSRQDDKETGLRAVETVLNVGQLLVAVHHSKLLQLWTRRALRVSRRLGDEVKAAALASNLGAILVVGGKPQRGVRLQRAALEMYRRLGDDKGEVTSLRRLGSAYNAMGQHAMSEKLYEEAHAAARAAGSLDMEADCLLGLGFALRVRGDWKGALECCEKALEIYKEIGEARFVGTALGQLSDLLLNTGEPDRAIEYAKQYVEITTEANDKSGEGVAQSALANALSNAGRLGEARAALTRSREISEEVGNPSGVATALVNEARLLLEHEDAETARPLLEQAAKSFDRIGDIRGMCQVNLELGTTFLKLRQADVAIKHAERSLKIAREIGFRIGEGHALGLLGQIKRDAGDLNGAEQLTREALSVLEELDDLPGKMNALANLAGFLAAKGDDEAAIRVSTETLTIAKLLGDVSCEAAVQYNLGLVYERLGRLGDAVDVMRTSVDTLEGLNHPGIQSRRDYVERLARRASKDE